MSSISSLLAAHPSSRPSSLCFNIFLTFYPSCIYPIHLHASPHLSPMYSISLWTFTQHCIDKQQQCQTKVTHKRASGFFMCQNPKLHHAILATSKTQLYPLSYVCIVIFPCQWQRDVNLLHKTCKRGKHSEINLASSIRQQLECKNTQTGNILQIQKNMPEVFPEDTNNKMSK